MTTHRKPADHLSPELQNEMMAAWSTMRIICADIGVDGPREAMAEIKRMRETLAGAQAMCTRLEEQCKPLSGLSRGARLG